ncbi:MAG: Flavin mononucleotide phosphatase YigB [Pseudomonadota bacterium]|jgi:FMN hydrolase / 5-amino-6-(5-phospho-D-ribitylamino)uracil phosphatase
MLDLTPIRAISLDLDDTLWPVWPTIERAERVLHDWLTRHAPAAAELGRDPTVLRSVREQVQQDWPDRRHDLAAMRQEAIRRLLVRAGEPDQLAGPAFEVFHAERQRVNLFEDALPLLRALQSRYPLLAVTNGTADVHRVGLGLFFAHAVNAPTLGKAKPGPEIYHHAARLLGLAPQQVLHIGDDAHLDAWAARNAGMACIWVNRQGKAWEQPGEPPPTVSGLGEILRWIESS